MKPLQLLIISLLGTMPLGIANASDRPDHDDITMHVIDRDDIDNIEHKIELPDDVRDEISGHMEKEHEHDSRRDDDDHKEAREEHQEEREDHHDDAMDDAEESHEEAHEEAEEAHEEAEDASEDKTDDSPSTS